jgi:hypothetical protein
MKIKINKKISNLFISKCDQNIFIWLKCKGYQHFFATKNCHQKIKQINQTLLFVGGDSNF